MGPVVPGLIPFDRISEVLTSHFQPKHLVIAERFHFHWRIQAMDESIAKFDAVLRRLATYCGFGGTLEGALRDRLACDLRNEATQRQLFTGHHLTHQKALDIVKGMETADSKTISLKTPEPSVNKVLH